MIIAPALFQKRQKGEKGVKGMDVNHPHFDITVVRFVQNSETGQKIYSCIL